MNHANQVIRRGGGLFGARFLVAVFSIAFAGIFARLLTKEEMAAFVVLLLLTSLTSAFKELGLSTSAIKLVPELISSDKKSEALSVIRTTFIAQVFAAAALATAIYIFSNRISELFLKTGEFAYLIKISAGIVLLDCISGSLGALLRAVQKFRAVSIITVVMDLSQRLLALCLFLLLGIKGFFAGFCFGSFLRLFLSVYFMRKYLFVSCSWHPFWKFARFSLPYYGGSICRVLLMRLDQLAIGLFLAPSSLALYFVSRKLVSFVGMGIEAFFEPIIPKIAELKASGIKKIEGAFNKNSRYLSFVLLPLVFLIASLSRFLIRLIGGLKYADGGALVAILCFAVLTYGYFSLYLIYVYVIGKPIFRLKLELFATIGYLILCGILIYTFKEIGVAIAKFVTFGLAALYAGTLLKKQCRAVFDKEALRNTLFASFIMFLVLVGLQLMCYRLFLIPIYILIGITVFMFPFCRNLKKKDIQLAEQLLPRNFFWIIKVFFFFGGSKLKVEMASA